MTQERDTGAVTEYDLHAYVDGVLPDERRVAVEAYLAARPDEAQRVGAWRQHRDELRALHGGVVDEPVPAHLAAWPRRRRALSRVAAAAALLALGAGFGWAAHGATGGRARAFAAASANLPRLAAVAHAVYSPEVRHPVEVSAGDAAHLVGWLSKRLGTELRPPDLRSLGYDLMGGRLLPGSRGPVAQFMYADASGARLTLYVSNDQAGGDTAFRFAQEGPVSVFYWVDGKLGYALSGQVARPELSRVTEAVYAQLAERRGAR